MDKIRIEKYISEIEDDVSDVVLVVKGFIGVWKSKQEKWNETT